MSIQKRQLRIGDLAKQLDVEKFVIRFWEKEFDMTTTRSDGGQRFYSEDDLEVFKRIKTLLYNEGFTIAGAKKQLFNEHQQSPIVGSRKTTISQEETQSAPVSNDVRDKLQEIKEKLEQLQTRY